MKEQIKNLVEDFRKIQAMSQDDAKERLERENELKSWFKKAESLGIKSEPGVRFHVESLTISISGIRHHHLSLYEAFENIRLFITARFGGKQKLHEVDALIHLPD